MGVSIDTGGKGGKKSLNADLNLVPFIDLLVCCICFLLITAVWSQMARIEVNQKGRGTAGKKTEDEPKTMQQKITLIVGEDGYTVTVGADRTPIPKRGDAGYDTEALAKSLREIKSRLTDKNDLTVAVEDGVLYQYIVEAMDVALQQHFVSIRLTDASAARM